MWDVAKWILFIYLGMHIIVIGLWIIIFLGFLFVNKITQFFK